LILILTLGAGCNRTPDAATGASVRLTTDTFQPGSAFEITFDEAMVGYGSVGQADAPSPLRIEPPLTGTFGWRSRRSGLFIPDVPARLGTRYVFTLAAGLTNLSGRPATARLHRTFETPGLEAAVTRSDYWPIDEMAPMPRVRVEFNAPVAVADLARHARFTDGQTHVTAEVEAIQRTRNDPSGDYQGFQPVTWRERFRPPPSDAERGTNAPTWIEPNARFLLRPSGVLSSTNMWALEIDEGLPAANDPIRLPRKGSFPLGISAPFRLKDATAESNVRRGRSLRLSFTRRLPESLRTNDVSTWLKCVPPVEGLTVEIGYSGHSLLLRGGFDLEHKYTVGIRTNLISDEGLALTEPSTVELQFAPIRPAVWLPSFETVQLARGRQALELLSVNTPEVRLRIKRLDRHSILPTLRAYDRYLRYPGSSEPDTLPPSALDYAGIPGRTLLDTNIVLESATDVPVTRTFHWANLLPAHPKGAWFIEADLHRLSNTASTSGTQVGPQSLVQLTDLGISTKTGRRETVVWIFSHQTAEPVAGARVALCTGEDEILAEGITAADGTVRLPTFSKAEWVVVEKDDDLHAEKLSEGSVPLWSLGVPHSTEATSTLRLFAFTDREAYRPGEELHLRLIARDWQHQQWTFPTNRTLPLVLTGPRSDVVLRTNLTLSDTGGLEWQWKVPTGTRGTYQAELGTNESATTLSFEVRDFQPSAFEVSLSAKPTYAPAEPIVVPLRARYLFGQSLASAKVVWSAEAADGDFAPKSWKGFRFGPDWRHSVDPVAGTQPGRSTVTGTNRLTGDAPVVLQPELPLNPITPRPQTIEITAEVTDLNQQTIAQSVAVTRDSSDFYLGFRWATEAETVLATNSPLHGQIVAVRNDGEPWPANVPVEVRLLRVQWNSVAILRAGGGIGYESHLDLQSVAQLTADSQSVVRIGETWEPAPGLKALTLPALSEPGSYQLELRSRDPAGRPVLTSFVFHVSGNARLAWHQKNGLQLALVPSRDSHQPGDVATLLVKSPFSGTAWVTIEQEEVRLSYVTNLIGNAPALHLPVDSADSPAAFVGVTLVRGSAGNPHQHPMPEWRFGYQELRVPSDRDHLEVRFQLATNAVAPGQTVAVTLHVSDSAGRAVEGAEVTLYAVDEGYLHLKGTAVPDPESIFQSPRPLGVATTLSLPRLLDEDPELRSFANKGHMAGGGGRSTSARRRFIPCPYWNTGLRSDAAGQVSVQFAAPDSLTRYRLVAVATHGPRRMGAGSDHFEVRKPLMIEPALPRFAHVGDQLSARALVFNTGASELTVAVRCLPGTNAQFVAGVDGTRRLNLPAGAIEVVEFPTRFVTPGSDPWRWSVATTNTLLQDLVEATLPVTHATPVQRQVVQVQIPPGGAPLLTGIDPALLENPETITIRVAANPLALVGESVRQLIHYPYGCVEQTGSSLLPWIALAELPGLLPQDSDRPTNAATVIQAGVQRLWSMQTADGGLAYWPGSSSAQRWGSAYAAWILTLAEQAGAEVTPARRTRLHDWLNRQWKQDTAPMSAEVLHERCLTAFALSSADAAEPTLNDLLYEARDQLSLEDRALLALAMVQSGQPAATARGLLTLPPPGHSSTSRFGGRARSLAIQLLAHDRLLPDAPETGRLTQQVLAEQQKGHWGTTQGNAWVLWSLARQALRTHSIVPVHGSIGFGKGPVIFLISGDAPVAAIQSPLGAQEGSLMLSHDGTNRLIAEVTVIGRALSQPLPTAEIDHGFQVRRTYARLDADNRELPATDLHVGDRVLVTLHIDAPENVDWVAIEDPLPAILEPIQGVFKTDGSARLPFQAQWDSDFREVRADRMLFFRDAFPEGRHVLRYMARVRSAGDCVAAPFKVEAMYEPQRHGFSASSRLSAAP
jgi:uncharacterized protein YfaS (alpha-2-macroglobulin family)